MSSIAFILINRIECHKLLYFLDMENLLQIVGNCASVTNLLVSYYKQPIRFSSHLTVMRDIFRMSMLDNDKLTSVTYFVYHKRTVRVHIELLICSWSVKV